MPDPRATGIRWPAEFDPARAKVHVKNELAIDAPPADVWYWLARATAWPSYYPNSANVVLEGGGDTLTPAQRFTWKTFGLSLKSQVEEFVLGERLAWNARGVGVWAYHAWLIRPTAAGCYVVTEETQFGFVARAGALLMPSRMGVQHQKWLEGLALQTKSGKGPPRPR